MKLVYIILFSLIPFRFILAQETTEKFFNIDNLVFEIGTIYQLEYIYFNYNSASLMIESKDSLKNVIKFLKENKDLHIEVRSHTDCNHYLSRSSHLTQKRAQSITNFFIENGVPKERLTAKGYEISVPYVIKKTDCEKYKFLTLGLVLSCENINKLESKEEIEIAHMLNRRTKIKIIKHI